MLYIVSLDIGRAIAYTGNPHHMSVRAAVRRFAADAIAVRYNGNSCYARDVLKFRSGGITHLSVTERRLIEAIGE